MAKGFVVKFAPPAPGELSSGVVLGFAGPGEPGARRRLTWGERKAKRRRAKLRRRAGKAR